MAGSNDDSLRIAIELFRASQESSSAQGKPVLAALDSAFQSGKITFVLLADGLNGQNQVDKIEMDQRLRNDPAKLSVWLVHEGYHFAAKRKELEIDEEIQSRQLQGLYWQGLTRGILFEGTTYKVLGLGELLNAYLKDQMVDWVLAMPQYTNKEGFLTQGWIVMHINDWKGLSNRNIFTKRMYVSVLVQRPDFLDVQPGARALFSILKSSTPGEAKVQISEAGGGDFSKGQKMAKERFSQVSGTTAETIAFIDSIVRWQNDTGIDLGMVPRR